MNKKEKKEIEFKLLKDDVLSIKIKGDAKKRLETTMENWNYTENELEQFLNFCLDIMIKKENRQVCIRAFDKVLNINRYGDSYYLVG